MPRKTGSHGQITGPRIRAAALRLFARHGYAAVSMRRIAAEVGVQAGALYTYIEDKQALLAELMRGHMTDLLAAWAACPGETDPLVRLEQFTRFHIAYHLDRPDEVFVSYMELRNLAPENFAEIEALRRRYETALEDILRAGRDAGRFEIADTKLAALALIAMLTGVTTWYREGGRLDRSEVADLYWQMVQGAVGLRLSDTRPAHGALQRSEDRAAARPDCI
jgi:AcrR family transcriptional regulator